MTYVSDNEWDEAGQAFAVTWLGGELLVAACSSLPRYALT